MRRGQNPGWFKKGQDRRRHKLTRVEKSRGGRKGWLSALRKHPGLYVWLRCRVLTWDRATRVGTLWEGRGCQ